MNLLMVSFARRRGDAAELVDGVEQGNESVVFSAQRLPGTVDD